MPVRDHVLVDKVATSPSSGGRSFRDNVNLHTPYTLNDHIFHEKVLHNSDSFSNEQFAENKMAAKNSAYRIKHHYAGYHKIKSHG